MDANGTDRLGLMMIIYFHMEFFLVRIDHQRCHSVRPFSKWMASSRVLLLSIPRAEAENHKPRIVHFWRNANEGVQFQEENAWCHVRTDVTSQYPLHNALMAPVEAFVVSNKVREM